MVEEITSCKEKHEGGPTTFFQHEKKRKKDRPSIAMKITIYQFYLHLEEVFFSAML